ncbi:hypothetical protein ACOYW6_12705 [Parablastomonas sp. CN1-191]|uniref:hypothetical protein n=1 Tax=Parablastomonas sp. CN1-191 TaxID=3400908 RepID=UPI003BF911F6
MKIADLEALARLEESATPGPWFVQHLDDDMRMGAIAVSRSQEHGPDENMRSGTWPTEDIVAACLIQSPPYAAIADDRHAENAELIAEMRNALPALLDLARSALLGDTCKRK